MTAILETVTDALAAAEQELKAAEIEAKHANDVLATVKTEHERLKIAVAALNGSEPADFAKPALAKEPEAEPEVDLSPPDMSNTGPLKPVEDDVPKTKPVKPDPDNPMANFKCRGCGRIGTTSQVLKTMPKSGRQIPVWQCSGCGSEKFA